jgi:hypothetical protein
MTEAEWLACADPQKMLASLRGRASGRKLRLFACACHRRVRHGCGDDDELSGAVDLIERHADGTLGGLGPGAIEQAEEALIGDANRGWRSTPWVEHASSYALDLATWPEWQRCEAAGVAAFQPADPAAARAALDLAEAAYRRAVAAERGEQCRLLRDIFGNPFRPPQVHPAWLTWNGGTVGKLAEAVYAKRAFDGLPVLADALEEAGCTNADILNHLRGPGPHGRGCWALDAVLGKT